MKKIVFTIILLIGFLGYSQDIAPKADAVRLNAKTTAEMNAFTRMENGTLCWNDETNSIWAYSDGVWENQEGGTMTDAEISTAFINENPNTDLNDANDIETTGDQIKVGNLTISDGVNRSLELTPQGLTIDDTNSNGTGIKYEIDSFGYRLQLKDRATAAFADIAQLNYYLGTEAVKVFWQGGTQTYFTKYIVSGAHSSPERGMLYFDNTDDTFKQYTNSGWENFASSADIIPVQNQIDSLIAVHGTIPSSAYEFNSRTSDYTIQPNDLKDNLIVKLEYNDENLIIPSGTIGEGQAVRIIYDNASGGDANIIEGSGVDILGYSDGITLSGYPSGLTLIRKNSNTSPEEYIIVDAFGTLTDYSAISLGAELLTNPNFDTDTSWGKQNGSTISGGEATVIGNGTINSTGANHSVYQDITALTNGTSYRLVIEGRRTVGSGSASVGIKFTEHETSVWTGSDVVYTVDFVAGASNQDRLAIGAESGTTIVVTSVSLKEIL